MYTTPTPFLFEGEITVRVIERDEAPWFVAADVCRALGMTNSSETVRGLDEDEKGISTTDALGGRQEVIVVSESGLYALIFESRKPHAVRFRKWVTSEVLPALRRAGKHAQATIPPLIVPVALALRTVNCARYSFGVRAAQQMWVKLGLPTVPAMNIKPDQGEIFVPMIALSSADSPTAC